MPVPVAANPAHLTHVEDPAVPAKVVVQQPITVIEGNVTVPELTAAEKARLVAELKRNAHRSITTSLRTWNELRRSLNQQQIRSGVIGSV